METKLENLGFDDFFESHRQELKIDPDSVARVIAEHREVYRIKNQKGEFSAKVTGRQIFEAESREDYPAVGDWVAADFESDPALIQTVLPRKSLLRKSIQSRKTFRAAKEKLIAANIDTALIVESVDRDYSLNRFERYFAIAADGNVQPAIILNKIDLISQDELDSIVSEVKKRFDDIDIIATSTTTASDLEELRSFIRPGKTYCFLGSSGVGKSSLINALIGKETARTGAIGRGTGRGKHVTTHREMYFLDNGSTSLATGSSTESILSKVEGLATGSSTESILSKVEGLATGGGILIDNPGMREVGLTNAGEGVNYVFNDIYDLALRCRFPDCTHIHEPGCAVLAAVRSGRIDEDRYDNFIQLDKEAEHHEMTYYEKRDKDRKFGKHIKKSLEKLDKYQK